MGNIEPLWREIHNVILDSARTGRDIHPLIADLLALAQRGEQRG